MPQIAYQTKASGATPKEISHYRSLGVAASGEIKQGRINTMVLRLQYGENGDPAVKIRKEMFKEWLHIWGEEKKKHGKHHRNINKNQQKTKHS